MRTRAELRLLVDVVQIAVTVAALVVLALPWWTYLADDHDHHSTGWDSLGDGTHGHAWAVIIAVVVTAGTTALRQRWLPIAGAIVCAVLALGFGVGASRVQSVHNHLDHAHAGLWVGLVLVIALLVNQIALAALRSSSTAP